MKQPKLKRQPSIREELAKDVESTDKQKIIKWCLIVGVPVVLLVVVIIIVALAVAGS